MSAEHEISVWMDSFEQDIEQDDPVARQLGLVAEQQAWMNRCRVMELYVGHSGARDLRRDERELVRRQAKLDGLMVQEVAIARAENGRVASGCDASRKA